MLRPTHCPYCGDKVSHMRPYEVHTPPDEREESTLVPPPASDPRPRFFKEVGHTISCQRLLPCGHIFRDDHLDGLETGTVTLNRLGDRVENPGQ